MDSSPDTRESLVVRLKDQADDIAWREFLEIYRPLMFRVAKNHGLQDADAEDVVQQALIAIMGAIGRWQKTDRVGGFRAWLVTITKNLLINFIARRKLRPVGGTSFALLLEQQPAVDELSRSFVEDEYRAELFRWAAEQVRSEFRPVSWEAFWRTAVCGERIADVAKALKLSVGSVYAARSRVVARIKRRVQQFEDNE